MNITDLVPPFQYHIQHTVDCECIITPCIRFGMMTDKTIAIIVSTTVVGVFSIYQAAKRIHKHKQMIKERMLTTIQTMRGSTRRSFPDMDA